MNEFNPTCQVNNTENEAFQNASFLMSILYNFTSWIKPILESVSFGNFVMNEFNPTCEVKTLELNT